MEVTRVEQRSYIKIAVLRGKNAKENHSELVEDLGNNALPYRIVARNEMADLLEKRGTDILQRSSRDLPLHSAKLENNRNFKKCFRDAATSVAKNKSWRVPIKPNCVSDFPCAVAVAEF
ncbi:hypothetical protein TNCV_1133561 [Trichonephila clavipes]|nr:hypothetical protein TNCV_1133561 [Trichonephila clavipes]